MRLAKDVRYAVARDETVDALRRAWRAEAFEEAARVCEFFIINTPAPTPKVVRTYLATVIRALKDKP